ncbi:MAG: hypothetical protein KF850_40140 [Labilithrix sp.]|nr:hypothetical protein [Labilithrix sp.]
MAGGHAWQARLVAYLGEVDHRKLYAAHACPSMWDLCVRKLGMSEGEAQRRIAAARVVRQFPRALAYLERGDIHLCAVYALRRHLTSDNHDELLREAAGKSTSDVELLIATRFPKPDVAQRIEHVAPQPSLALTPAGDGADARASASEARPRIEPLSATRYRVELTVSADLKAKLDRSRDLMRHRNPTGDLETILDISLGLLLAKLERERLGKTSRRKAAGPPPACDGDRGGTNDHERDGGVHAPMNSPSSLTRFPSKAGDDDAVHAPMNTPSSLTRFPSDAGDNDAVHAPMNERPGDVRMNDARPSHALTTTSADVPTPTPATTGATPTPTPTPTGAMPTPATTGAMPTPTPAKSGSETTDGHPRTPMRARAGTIPRATRREVFARDGEQCTYVGGGGDRCPGRGYLELDHVHPKALGGGDTAMNLRVRCRAHNQMYAEQVFGRSHIERRVHLRQRKYEGSAPSSLEQASSALRSMGFREPEVRKAVSALDDPCLPVETIVRQALTLLT